MSNYSCLSVFYVYQALPACLSACMPVSVCVYLFVYQAQPAFLSFYQAVHVCLCMCTYLSARLCLSFCLSVCVPGCVCLSIRQTAWLSVRSPSFSVPSMGRVIQLRKCSEPKHTRSYETVWGDTMSIAAWIFSVPRMTLSNRGSKMGVQTADITEEEDFLIYYTDLRTLL